MIRAAPATCAPRMVGGPHAARSDDGDGRARAHLGGVDRGAEAGGESAADQRQLVGREVRVHGDARRLVDRDHVGEAADACERVGLGAVGAGGAQAGEHLGVEVAEVRLLAQAVPARAAHGRDRHDHPVAGLHARHGSPGPLDDPGCLVTEHDRAASACRRSPPGRSGTPRSRRRAGSRRDRPPARASPSRRPGRRLPGR